MNINFKHSEKIMNKVIELYKEDEKAPTNYSIIIIIMSFFIFIDLFILMIKSLFKR